MKTTLYDVVSDMLTDAEFLPWQLIESGDIRKGDDGVMNITLRSTALAEKVVFWIEHELPTTQELRYPDGGIQLYHAATNEFLDIELTKLN